MWRLKPTVHFLGASMHAAWHFGMFPREDFGVAYSYCCDLIRSVVGSGAVVGYGTAGRPDGIHRNRPLNPTGGERSLAGCGTGSAMARGASFSGCGIRARKGNEAGEWALAGAGRGTDRTTRATRAVAAGLRQHEDFFARGQAAPGARRRSSMTAMRCCSTRWMAGDGRRTKSCIRSWAATRRCTARTSRWIS